MKNLFIDKFCGIRHVNSVSDIHSKGIISAIECRNVELQYTERGGNVGIFTAPGNKAVKDIGVGKTIKGQFESVQNGVSYWIIYAIDENRGYLYVWDYSNEEEPELLDITLAASNVCNGITIAQGFNDWFVFTNGIDDYVGICMANNVPEERVVNLNATDAEGRDIRGLALEIQEGRLVTICKNRVHWSAQGNIFDWNSSDALLKTIPAYQEFDRDLTAVVYYNNTLIAFTADYSVVFKGNPSDPENFTRAGAAGGGCASYKSLIRFDNKLFYYDHKARNVFAYYILDTGQTRPTQGYADNVMSYFGKIRSERLNEIEIVSYICGMRNEIWFKLPIEEQNIILIYDYLKQEWIERMAQNDICALAIVADGLYSAAKNLILKEYLGSGYNGKYIPSEYKTTIINLGSDSNTKVPKMPLILTLDWSYDNDFYIEFIYDDLPEKSKIKHIVKLASGYLIWSKTNNDENGGLWALDEDDEDGGLWVTSDKNTVMFNLDGVPHFKQLQIRIFTMEAPQEFSIKRLEFKRVGLKTKSLG